MIMIDSISKLPVSPDNFIPPDQREMDAVEQDEQPAETEDDKKTVEEEHEVDTYA